MSRPPVQQHPLYGLLGEFEHPAQLLSAAERAYQAGYRKMNAYTPIPLHGLSDALGQKPTRLPYLVLAGGLLGGGRGLCHALLCLRHQLSLQHRRPAA